MVLPIPEYTHREADRRCISTFRPTSPALSPFLTWSSYHDSSSCPLAEVVLHLAPQAVVAFSDHHLVTERRIPQKAGLAHELEDLATAHHLRAA
jgi:hypothetical protein